MLVEVARNRCRKRGASKSRSVGGGIVSTTFLAAVIWFLAVMSFMPSLLDPDANHSVNDGHPNAVGDVLSDFGNSFLGHENHVARPNTDVLVDVLAMEEVGEL